MEKFIKLTGRAVPLDRADVDTDQIIPKQFLKKIERTGFGAHLFHDWRFLNGDPDRPDPDFILNQSQYAGASVLLARDNFGCGSSREHAPWALEDYGFRAILAPSFADIFFNNCFKNGMLAIVLPAAAIQELFAIARQGHEFTIDLVEKRIQAGGKSYEFSIDDFRRECLLNGWDDIGLTLRHKEALAEFEVDYLQKFAYLNSGLKSA